MANKGSVSVTSTISAAFGTGSTADLVIQNTGTSNAFVSWDTAEVDKGLRIAPGETVNTGDLPSVWRAKSDTGFTAICDTGDSTTLIWTA